MISMLNQIERLLKFVKQIHRYHSCQCSELQGYTCFHCEAEALLNDEPVRLASPSDERREVLNPKYPRCL